MKPRVEFSAFFILVVAITILNFNLLILGVNIWAQENGEWGRLHNVEFHSLFSLLNMVRVIKSRKLRLVGHISREKEGRSASNILTGKPTGKRPLGRLRRRWLENIIIDIRNWCQYEELR